MKTSRAHFFGSLVTRILLLPLLLLLLLHILIYQCPYSTAQSLPGNSPLSLSDIKWAWVHSRACGRECHNNSKYDNGFCSDLNCFPCDCDESCALVGTCCPFYQADTNTYSYPVEFSPDDDPSRWYGLLECWQPQFAPGHYLSVVRCPSSWTDERVRQQCENPSSNSMVSILPFSEKKTRLVFANYYCLTCNGYQVSEVQTRDEDIHPWSIIVICTHYQNLFHLTDMVEFLRAAAADWRQCAIKYQDIFNEAWAPRRCNRNLDTRGHEGVYNSTDNMSFLCSNLPPVPGLAVSGSKNVFCKIHNEGYKLEITTFCLFLPTPPTSVIEDFVDSLPPMYILFSPSLSSSKDRLMDAPECPSGHWMDETGNCTLARCSPGKTLNALNATCPTAIADIRGLGYTFSMVLRPTGGFVMTIQDSMPIQMAIEQRLEAISPHWKVHIAQEINECLPTREMAGGLELLHITISGYIIAPRLDSRDDFESLLEKDLMSSPWEISYVLQGDKTSQNLSLEILSIGADMTALYQMHSNLLDQEKYLKNSFSEKEGRCSRHVMASQSPELYPTERNRVMLTQRHSFIDITPKLTCPYVELDTTEASFGDNKTLVFTVTIHGEEIKITPGTGISLEGGKILMCLKTFNSFRKIHETTDSLLIKVIYYLEIICTCISVLCLVVSFLTFSFFKSLRSLPGLNNMCLCFSMATAQTSLLVTTIFKEQLSETHCLVNGVIVHYSWLATFCWLNTCCVHMFRVFTSTRGPGGYSERKTHLCYSLYSFGIPALIIIATASISLGVTGGDKMGYSDDICFIDTQLSSLVSILSLLVPFGATMVVNAVLFGLTIKEIIQVSRLQKTIKSSHGVMTYVKLSTVTGLFLILAATGVLTEQPIIMLLATPLMALQGLFIFLSFIVNKTVWTLYQELMCKGAKSETTSALSDATRKTEVAFTDASKSA